MISPPLRPRIAVASFNRAEFSACRTLLLAAASDARVVPQFIAGGSHLGTGDNHMIGALEKEGITTSECIPLPTGDTPAEAAAALAAAAVGMAAALKKLAPDILVLAGDRSELLGAAGAATVLGVPLAHVSGGEITAGAYDDAVRHALTKLSHLHFVAMDEARRRIEQLGEESWRITVCGDPSLDHVLSLPRLPRDELERAIGQELTPPVVVLTWHPATVGGHPQADTEELVAGMTHFTGTLVITAANTDPGGETINHRLRALADHRPRTGFHTALGPRRFSSLLALADAIVGNSSSGIWESASYLLPALNIGDRQRGRHCARNVVHSPCVARDIGDGLRTVLNPAFRAGLNGLANPYGDGHAARRIIDVLAKLPSRDRLLRKHFKDL